MVQRRGTTVGGLSLRSGLRIAALYGAHALPRTAGDALAAVLAIFPASGIRFKGGGRYCIVRAGSVCRLADGAARPAAGVTCRTVGNPARKPGAAAARSWAWP